MTQSFVEFSRNARKLVERIGFCGAFDRQLLGREHARSTWISCTWATGLSLYYRLRAVNGQSLNDIGEDDSKVLRFHAYQNQDSCYRA